jgi:hypothetical protein
MMKGTPKASNTSKNDIVTHTLMLLQPSYHLPGPRAAAQVLVLPWNGASAKLLASAAAMSVSLVM